MIEGMIGQYHNVVETTQLGWHPSLRHSYDIQASGLMRHQPKNKIRKWKTLSTTKIIFSKNQLIHLLLSRSSKILPYDSMKSLIT